VNDVVGAEAEAEVTVRVAIVVVMPAREARRVVLQESSHQPSEVALAVDVVHLLLHHKVLLHPVSPKCDRNIGISVFIGVRTLL